MRPSTPEALKLFHEGTLALADVEANGWRIDTDYLDKAITLSGAKIKHLESELRESEEYKTLRRQYGSRTNLGAPEQIAWLLFTALGHKSKSFSTKTGKASAEEANLQDIDSPFVTKYLELCKYKRCKGTFLEGIKTFATDDGLLHPNFNLNIASSFRSTSNDPNFQNYPTRTEWMAKLVRSCFIPRDDHVIVESDFGGIEVGVAGCYNKDPRLIADYTEGDMHRDMAIKLFNLPKEEIDKKVRYCSKNMFVFPNFYGSYWFDCARNLWEAVERMKLKTVSGVPLYDHLAGQGIRRLGKAEKNDDPKRGTFQFHVKQQEDYLWNTRYKVYTAWKKSTWAEYQLKGYTKLKTGFVCSRDSDGLVMNRKQVINYQIQGAAFHCLLWCLIEMNRWLRINKMRSKIVSQIHDSIIGDVHKDELHDYTHKMKELMTKSLMQAWKWVIVPLKVEMEACPLGGNWFQKKVIEV